MTPLQRIREDPDKVRDMLVARGFDAPLDRILELDRKARDLRAQVEVLNAERNKASRGGPPSDEVKAQMRDYGPNSVQRTYELNVSLPSPANRRYSLVVVAGNGRQAMDRINGDAKPKPSVSSATGAM